MINKVKSFFTHKRCKSRLNNKGFSLIEIMVALGLIIVLVGLAIPQYQSYTRTAKYGVVRTMLTVPYRTMEVESSLGKQPSSASAGFLWARVKSNAKGEFNTTNMAYNNSGNNWCFYIEGASGKAYDGFTGCINQAGSITIGGSNIPCSQAKEKQVATASSTPGSPACTHTTCSAATGGKCKRKGATAVSCNHGAAGFTTEGPCEPGSDEVYTKAVTCNSSGVCS